jgi:hypothetical protein
MTPTPVFGFNPFLDGQRDPNRASTHWTISDGELLDRIKQNWPRRRPGYRDGVVLVPISPEGFLTAVRLLVEGDRLEGVYRARREGETPRKLIYFKSDVPVAETKIQPQSVDVVLYHRDVLAEDGEVVPEDWSVITVLGKQCGEEEEEPMNPETLMANHFHDSGGTQTKMSDSQFTEALRRSYWYWRDKVMGG